MFIDNQDVNLSVDYEPFYLDCPEYSQDICKIVESEEPVKSMVKYIFDNIQKDYSLITIMTQLCSMKEYAIATDCFKSLVKEPIDLSYDINDKNILMMLIHIYRNTGKNMDVAIDVISKLIECNIKGVNQMSFNSKLNHDHKYILNSHMKLYKDHAYAFLQENGETIHSKN